MSLEVGGIRPPVAGGVQEVVIHQTCMLGTNSGHLRKQYMLLILSNHPRTSAASAALNTVPPFKDEQPRTL